MNQILRYALLIAIISLNPCYALADRPEVKIVSENIYEIPSGCDFSLVVNYPEVNNCSPKLLDAFFSPFEGVLINGPAEIVWPKSSSLEDFSPGALGQTEGPLRFMIAGLARVKFSYLGLRGQVSRSVLVVAVNQKTAKTYSGKMPSVERDFWSEPISAKAKGPRREDYPEYRDALHSSNFNLDLVHDLGLPIEDAVYSVYATLGDFKSNMLTVKTTVK